MSRRHELQHETFVGFLGFFAFVAVIQAVFNVFAPEPAIWPGLLAGGMVAITWWFWRWGRKRFEHTGQLSEP